jgi:hypothetical protein
MKKRLITGVAALTLAALSGATALGCIVTGTVKCANDRIFPDVVITITDEGGTVVGTEAVGPDGAYSFTLATDGIYTAALSNLPDGITSASYSVNGGAYVPGTSVTGPVSGDLISLNWLLDGPACAPCGPGTGTPGYWKNHPEAWPVDSITVGGITYTKAQAIYIMSSAVEKDKWITMFKGLVAAKLNVAIGTDPTCIAATITAANLWMETYASPVRASSEAWHVGEPLYCTLDAYNNGLLCAPSRDVVYSAAVMPAPTAVTAE